MLPPLACHHPGAARAELGHELPKHGQSPPLVGDFNKQFLLFAPEAALLLQEGIVDELETEKATVHRLDWKPSVAAATRQGKLLAAIPPGKRRDSVEKALNCSRLDVSNSSNAGVTPPCKSRRVEEDTRGDTIQASPAMVKRKTDIQSIGKPPAKKGRTSAVDETIITENDWDELYECAGTTRGAGFHGHHQIYCIASGGSRSTLRRETTR